MAERREQVLLRKASAKEAKGLYLIRYEAYLPIYARYGQAQGPCTDGLEQLHARISQGDVYGICLGQRGVGMMQLRVAQGRVCMEQLCVLPAYRRQGIARTALALVELEVPAARYQAKVPVGDSAAEGLLDKTGYQQAGEGEAAGPRLRVTRYQKDMLSYVGLQLSPLSREDLPQVRKWLAALEPDELCAWAGKPASLDDTFFHPEAGDEKGRQMDFAVRAPELNALVGVISLTKLDWEVRRGTVANFILDPLWRGCGAGRRVMEQLCRLAFDQWQLRGLTLNVMDVNQAAMSCFQNSGFVETLRKEDVHTGGDGRHWARVVMMRGAKENGAWS